MHAFAAIDRTPAEAQLHRLVALVLVALGLGAEFVESAWRRGGSRRRECAPWCGRRAGDRRAASRPCRAGPRVRCRPRRSRSCATPLRPKAMVRRYICCHRNSMSHGSAPRSKRLEIGIDQRLRDQGRKRGIAQADEAGVGEDLNQLPSRGRRSCPSTRARIADQVHRVGTEMRRERNRFALPLNDARANFSDLHTLLSISRRS